MTDRLSDLPLATRRTVLAHLSVCKGCCCGAVERGKPDVPVDWLKSEWKRRGLKKSIQLTITGCLGPCDLSNVVSLASASGTAWCGALQQIGEYAALLEWAETCAKAGTLAPLPQELQRLAFDPFLREPVSSREQAEVPEQVNA